MPQPASNSIAPQGAVAEKLDVGAAVAAQPGARPSVLILAYTCHPEASMESRLAWKRVELAADRHDVTVICGPARNADELHRLAEEHGLGDRVVFHPLEHDRLGEKMIASSWLWYSGYHRWHTSVLAIARRLNAERPFDLVHQVSYCGYREPGAGWRLGPPFIWGPIGGTQNFPWRFLRYAGLAGGTREVVRNLVNAFQLRFSRRVAAAARSAELVIAATRRARHDLQRRLERPPELELETGLDCPIAPPREPRDPAEPLRILTAGRLQPWKGTPLLFHALAALPEDLSYEVRVLGDGPCLGAWRRLAARLGVGERVRFVPWPAYEETLPHYRWADVLVFPSLRDTSGTGLIESLASGAPIIGLDHQGAADVMTDECSVMIPVRTPRQVVADLRAAIVALAGDADRLSRMSRAAQLRAEDFCWEHRLAATNERYARAMNTTATTPETQPSSTTDRPALAADLAG